MKTAREFLNEKFNGKGFECKIYDWGNNQVNNYPLPNLLEEFAEQQVKNLNIPAVSKSADTKSKIKVDDPNAPWNWKKDISEL